MAMNRTDVEYNGVKILNVVTRRWDQQVEYDDSGTDMLYHKFSLMFDGIVHSHGDKSLGVSPSAKGDAVGTQQRIRKRLLQPRGKLVVKMGNRTILVAHAAGTKLSQRQTEDRDNGPKPKAVGITHVAGGNLFRITFEIECCITECGDSPSAQGSVILNNRWGITEEMDVDFFTTRTIIGKLVIGSSNVKIQEFRNIVVPGLEDGFRRERISFSSSPDGLTAEYQITDKQVRTAAPYPATSIEGRHTESTSDGYKMYTEVSVRLSGPPDVDTRDLLSLAIRVINSRTNYLNERNNGGIPSVLVHGSITEHLGTANVVDASVKLLRNDPNAKDAQNATRMTFAKLLATQGTPLTLPGVINKKTGEPYNPTKSVSPALYGYDVYGKERSAAVLNVLAVYLQTPCKDQHVIGEDTKGQTFDERLGRTRKRYDVINEVAYGSIPLEKPVLLADDIGRTSLYTLYKASSRYDRSQQNVQLPMAGPSPSGGYVSGNPDIPNPPGDSTAVVYALSKPIYRRILTVEAERVGAWPEMPWPEESYTDGKMHGTLLHHRTIQAVPGVSPDASKRTFRITGEYVYAVNRPPSIGEKNRVGSIPFLRADQGDNQPNPIDIYSNQDLRP